MADLRVGNTPITDVRIGGTQIQKVYAGSSLIWSAYVPISSVTITPPNPSGSVFRPEPAPDSVEVRSSSINVSWSGGNPGATVTWSHISGDTLLTIPTGSTGYFGDNVPKNSSKSSVYRATVIDGISSAYQDCSVALTYTTTT